MNVVEFEQKVFEIEDVRVVVRAASNDKIGDYSYQKCSPRGNSIADWVKQRIAPNVNGREVVVIDGSGAIPNRRTLMSTLRHSYEHSEDD